MVGNFPERATKSSPGVGCARGDIDERSDLRIHPRFADEGAAPGMSDQHGWTILQRQRTPGFGDGLGKRREGILDCRDMQAGRLKTRDDLAPT